MKREIFYATGNRGKFEDLHTFLKHSAPEITLLQFAEELPELQSTDQRFVAIEKAKEAWRRLHRPVLIDDAGIYFERYDDFPGVFTKYFYRGVGFAGIQRLVPVGDPVYYQLHLVYAYGDSEHAVFVGRCDGTLVYPSEFPLNPPLPFDTLFVPRGETRTFAELRALGILEPYDHRVAACKDFLRWFRAER
ncbi:MAG: hypothetical protein M1549_02675 [Candidatus Dependentiae bacterium]|nr:hypothetical protein [Candidatus Dependentiae bacterium]